MEQANNVMLCNILISNNEDVAVISGETENWKKAMNE